MECLLAVLLVLSDEARVDKNLQRGQRLAQVMIGSSQKAGLALVGRRGLLVACLYKREAVAAHVSDVDEGS